MRSVSFIQFYTERGKFLICLKSVERGVRTQCALLKLPNIKSSIFAHNIWAVYFTPQLCRMRAKLSVILSAALSRETRAHLHKRAADKIFMVSVCLFKQTHQGPKSPAAVTLWHITSRAAETAVKVSIWELFFLKQAAGALFWRIVSQPRVVNKNGWDWRASSTTILPLNVHP